MQVNVVNTDQAEQGLGSFNRLTIFCWKETYLVVHSVYYPFKSMGGPSHVLHHTLKCKVNLEWSVT